MRPSRFLSLRAGLLLALVVAGTAHAAGSVVFRDDFSNPRSGWATRTNEHGAWNAGISLYTGSDYQMSPVEDGTLGFSPSPKQARSARVEIASKVFMYAGVGNGAAGVACRVQDGDRFYAFLLTGNNAWMIVKATPEKLERLAAGAIPIKPSMPGLVDVRVQAQCDGEVLRMRINGKDVGSARDGAYADGLSGLMVMGEKAAGTNARFDDFALGEL